MHKAWTGSKQDPVRGDKILNSHKTLEKDTKGLSIADSSLTQPYVACPGETSLLSRGFWLENRHVIVQSIMDDMVTPLPQSSPSRSWWRETNAPPATGTFPGRYSTMVSWIAAIFLTGSFVTVLVVASSTSKIDRFEAPEQALSLMVGRTMDLQEGLTRAPDWEQQLMAWVSGDGAAERVHAIEWYRELAKRSDDPLVPFQLAILQAEAGQVSQALLSAHEWKPGRTAPAIRRYNPCSLWRRASTGPGEGGIAARRVG